VRNVVPDCVDATPLRLCLRSRRYSAVKIKFSPGKDMKEVCEASTVSTRLCVSQSLTQVTVSIFSTGKTIITGAETLQEIVFAYKSITEFVNLHADKIKVEPTYCVDTFDFIEGWKITDAVDFFKRVGVAPFETPEILYV
jgi:hypothetical protein